MKNVRLLLGAVALAALAAVGYSAVSSTSAKQSASCCTPGASCCDGGACCAK